MCLGYIPSSIGKSLNHRQSTDSYLVLPKRFDIAFITIHNQGLTFHARNVPFWVPFQQNCSPLKRTVLEENNFQGFANVACSRRKYYGHAKCDNEEYYLRLLNFVEY